MAAHLLLLSLLRHALLLHVVDLLTLLLLHHHLLSRCLLLLHDLKKQKIINTGQLNSRFSIKGNTIPCDVAGLAASEMGHFERQQEQEMANQAKGVDEGTVEYQNDPL